jgi:hypothetical protein
MRLTVRTGGIQPVPGARRYRCAAAVVLGARHNYEIRMNFSAFLGARDKPYTNDLDLISLGVRGALGERIFQGSGRGRFQRPKPWR